MVNPAWYESEDGVFNLPLFLYDSLRDVMKAEFDQIRASLPEQDAQRVVRLVKSRYQTLWSNLSMALFRLGLVEPCTCRPQEICEACHGAQWIMVRGIDYKKLQQHSDEILRRALTRRMQTPEFKRIIERIEDDGT